MRRVGLMPGGTRRLIFRRDLIRAGERSDTTLFEGSIHPDGMMNEGMLTSIFLVFVGGWLLWFWIDKPPAGQFGLPPPGESIVQDFQRSIDLLKAGHPDMAYLYVWYAHYLVISVLLGILLAVLVRALSGLWSRRRRRSRYHPVLRAGDASTSQGPASPPAAATTADDAGVKSDATR